jgi:hypothetical protein
VGSSTQSAALTVTPVKLLSLTLNPATVVGGNGSTATVSLSGPAPAAGILVTLSSSQKNVAQVPVNILIPAGAVTGTFAITTKNTNATKTSSISCKNNGMTVSATITTTK